MRVAFTLQNHRSLQPLRPRSGQRQALLLLAFLSTAGLGRNAQAATTPTALSTLETYREKLRVIVAGDGALEVKRKKVQALLREVVDFTQVAEQTLGAAQWAKLDGAQRRSFAAVLEQLVEASYVSRVDKANTADIAFAASEADPNTVKATAHASGSEVHLEFKMKPAPKGFMLADLLIDDVSIIRNYKSQFSKQLSKGSVAELQARLEKKTTELRAQ